MTAKDDNVDPTPSLSLDEVHHKTMMKLENEPVEPEDEEKKEPVEGEPVKEEPKEKEPVTPEPKEEPKELPKEEEEEPELDTDITNPGEGKIGIKNSDGEMNYFNNVDEIPDDFEPNSYKEFAQLNVKMAEKEQSDKQAANARAEAKAKSTREKEVQSINDAWESEIKELADKGILPKDDKKRADEVNETYAYMSKRLNEGVRIDSFTEAYKSRMFDKMHDDTDKKKEEEYKLTKDRGSKVMGGSSAASNEKQAPAIPSGTTLDQVHAKYSGLI